MNDNSRLPFKSRTKYVAERDIAGEKTILWKNNDKTVFKPSNSVDNRVASVINDSDFGLEGTVVDDCFYVSDIFFYDGGDLRDLPWPERYKLLKNEFRWNSAVKINRPLVVKNRDELRHAVELFEMLDYTDGVVVRDYDGVYDSEKTFLEVGD